MDVNDLRTLLMVMAFVTFVGIVVWTYSRQRKDDFEQAARLPFDEEDEIEGNGATRQTKVGR